MKGPIMVNNFNQPSFSAWAKQVLVDIDSCGSDFCWHLVYDPCLGPEIGELATLSEPPLKPWPLYLNTYSEEAQKNGPQLLKLIPGSVFNHRILEIMAPKPLGLLIMAEAEKQGDLFEHLQDFFECLEEDGKRILFRYYDPRVFYGFTTYTDQAQARLLLGPALRMLTWEPGRCQPVELAQDKDHGLRSQGGVMGLSETFTDHLWGEARIHTVIGALKEMINTPFQPLIKAQPLAETYKYVENVLHRLKDYPMSNYNLMASTLLTMEYGWEYWDNTKIATRMDLGRSNTIEMKRTLLALMQTEAGVVPPSDTAISR
jgi:hypothetical protein